MSCAAGGFEDHFSKQAAIYARSRPRYPAGLFAYLAGLVERRRIAWDCGTGNGQAAIGLVEHFERVMATDASARQLAQAIRHERIEYREAAAEESGLEGGSVDLAVAANALHWFDFDRFYAELRRVVRPGGVFAAWSSGVPRVSTLVDTVCMRLHDEVLRGYWLPANRLVAEEYKTIPFPLVEIPVAGEYATEQGRSMGEYVAYLHSWSAVQRFKDDRGYDPVEEVAEALSAAWGPPEESRLIRWPTYLRVGRLS